MRTGRRSPPWRMKTYKEGQNFAYYCETWPLCSQGVWRTWPIRVLHSEGNQVKNELESMNLQAKVNPENVRWESSLWSAFFSLLIQLLICFSSNFRFVINCLDSLSQLHYEGYDYDLRWWKSQGEIWCCVAVFSYSICLFSGRVRS